MDADQLLSFQLAADVFGWPLPLPVPAVGNPQQLGQQPIHFNRQIAIEESNRAVAEAFIKEMEAQDATERTQ